jgi:hypothetical protein
MQAENVSDDIIALFAREREHGHTRVRRGESDQQRRARHPRGVCKIWKSRCTRVWRANLPSDSGVTLRANLLHQVEAFFWVAGRLRVTEVNRASERQKSCETRIELRHEPPPIVPRSFAHNDFGVAEESS